MKKGRVELLYEDYRKALNALKEGIMVAKTDLEVEGVLKRFELVYELAWKLLKEVLSLLGIVCRNPRECFKHAVSNGFLENVDVWLRMIRMIEDRNELVHVYSFEGSREIFERIKKDYLAQFERLESRAEEFLKEELA